MPSATFLGPLCVRLSVGHGSRPRGWDDWGQGQLEVKKAVDAFYRPARFGTQGLSPAFDEGLCPAFDGLRLVWRGLLPVWAVQGLPVWETPQLSGSRPLRQRAHARVHRQRLRPLCGGGGGLRRLLRSRAGSFWQLGPAEALGAALAVLLGELHEQQLVVLTFTPASSSRNVRALSNSASAGHRQVRLKAEMKQQTSSHVCVRLSQTQAPDICISSNLVKLVWH